MCPDDPIFQAKVISLSKKVNQGIHSPDWEMETGKQKYRSGDRAYTYIINTAYTNRPQNFITGLIFILLIVRAFILI